MHYGLGQKIPASLKPFTRQEITNKQFSAKHSSILRILTKWAGYLEDVFSNAEHFVKRRLYAFKNIHNELHNLDSSKEGSDRLIKRLKEEYQDIRGKFYNTLKDSYGFIGKILSKHKDSFVSSVNRYS
jgi:hypothetical protein